MELIDVGGPNKSNLMPPEVCQVLPGQPFRGKLTDDHTANMITHACKPPNINARAIVLQGLDSLGFKTNQLPLPGFGISIKGQMTMVPARVLPMPRVMYSSKAQEVDARASWNLRSVKFSRGASLDKWAVLLIRDGNTRGEFQGPNDPELHQTIKGFMKMCTTSGMIIRNEPRYIQAQLPPKRDDDHVRRKANAAIRSAIVTLSPRVDLIMVILSSGDKNVYAGIKHLCDVILDVHTVCVHSDKIRKEKGQLQYFANVALKFNMKLGGINHNLDMDSMQWLKQEPTMLVGMDVTHPGPGSLRGSPSIAAVVASVDDQFAQYPASLKIQESKKEVRSMTFSENLI